MSRAPTVTPRRRALALLPAVVALPLVAHAEATPPPEIAAELPGARVQGSGRLRVLGLRVYDMRLWVPAGQRVGPDDWPRTPLALEIEYARGFQGRLIAERSLDEMRRQGEIPAARRQAWLDEMTRLFPDVREGDRLTGIKRPGEIARFYGNGRLLGEVRDADFARVFFGIWLSERTSEPSLRDALLGPSRASS